jgi:N-acetylmuramoyl-L-alanine amidase
MEILYMGSSGSNVEKLQQKLQEQELYLGPIDGLFGQGVEMAVKEFQTIQGLAADGIAGLSTLTALGLITLERDPDLDA